DFAWLQSSLQAVYRAGSFLFCHAGVDDVIARELTLGGVDAINEEFRTLLTSDPFALYNGPVGNLFRTKYRKQDFPFTHHGAACLRSMGVLGIVHGHKSHVTGQQMQMRKGIAHFECDTSLDRNTRLKCGLPGIGRAATIIGCDSVRAISNDSMTERVLAATPA
ncbi:MAG: metallophosphoesterase, partial [Myxococcota bacterium]